MNKYFTPQQQREFDDKMMKEFIESVEASAGHPLSIDERLQCEELMELAKSTGRKAAREARIAEHTCKFCECPVDNDLEKEWRKSLPVYFPRLLTGRLAYGFERDKDGEWMHANSWQCIVSWQMTYGPLAESDTDNAKDN